MEVRLFTLPQLALNSIMNIFHCPNIRHEYFIHLDRTLKLTCLRYYNILYHVNEENFSEQGIVP